MQSFQLVAVLACLAAACGGGSGSSSTCTTTRWQISDDGTVLDTMTSHTWQRGDSVQDGTGGIQNWSSAGPYCTNLPLSGGGWRLPSKDELATLILTTPDANGTFIDECVFPFAPHNDVYWTSTTYSGNSDDAYHVTFSNGAVNYTSKTMSSRADAVRCIR